MERDFYETVQHLDQLVPFIPLYHGIVNLPSEPAAVSTMDDSGIMDEDPLPTVPSSGGDAIVPLVPMAASPPTSPPRVRTNSAGPLGERSSSANLFVDVHGPLASLSVMSNPVSPTNVAPSAPVSTTHQPALKRASSSYYELIRGSSSPVANVSFVDLQQGAAVARPASPLPSRLGSNHSSDEGASMDDSVESCSRSSVKTPPPKKLHFHEAAVAQDPAVSSASSSSSGRRSPRGGISSRTNNRQKKPYSTGWSQHLIKTRPRSSPIVKADDCDTSSSSSSSTLALSPPSSQQQQQQQQQQQKEYAEYVLLEDLTFGKLQPCILVCFFMWSKYLLIFSF